VNTGGQGSEHAEGEEEAQEEEVAVEAEAKGRDAMSGPQAVATVRIDNARVRVTEWRFAPGTRTGHHRHEYAYVIVPLTTGSLVATTADGESTAALRSGEPYFREAGVEHDVRNANPFEFAFLEIELKTA
jgi:quercetin dioxygenase-like cupin family protein